MGKRDTPVANTSNPKYKPYSALLGAGIIAVGFIPSPLTDPDLPKATWLEYCISVLPVLPLLILLLCTVSRRRIPAIAAIIATFLVLAIGGLLTRFLAAFSGGGREMAFLHGATLTVAIGASIILVSTCAKSTKRGAQGVFIFSVCIALWSLSVIPIAYTKASKIASGRPLCIAAHSPIEKELTSLMGLRGFSFYTTLSGYKVGDTWYFHGVLLVDGSDGMEVYNWSPQSMNFHELENPGRMLVSPLNACLPREDFLQNLPVV